MSHPLTVLLITLVVLVALDLAALRWGVDSRFSDRIDGRADRSHTNW